MPNGSERRPGLAQVDPVVAGGQPKREVVALRPALPVLADPRPVLRRRPSPKVEVRRSQTLEERDQRRGVVVAVMQPRDPEILVVAEELGLIVGEDPAVAARDHELGVDDVGDALEDAPPSRHQRSVDAAR